MNMQHTRDRRTHGRAYSENLKKRDHFEGIDERILLKMIIKMRFDGV